MSHHLCAAALVWCSVIDAFKITIDNAHYQHTPMSLNPKPRRCVLVVRVVTLHSEHRQAGGGPCLCIAAAQDRAESIRGRASCTDGCDSAAREILLAPALEDMHAQTFPVRSYGHVAFAMAPAWS